NNKKSKTVYCIKNSTDQKRIKDLEDFDKYLIVLGAITLAEQKPEDFEHRYWLNNLIQKQLRNGLELTQYYSLRNFKTIRLTPEKTEDVKREINQKLQEIKQKYYPEQLEKLYQAN
ncbi:11556_t:CDS:1, partial [Dentiscutata erythropus]